MIELESEVVEDKNMKQFNVVDLCKLRTETYHFLANSLMRKPTQEILLEFLNKVFDTEAFQSQYFEYESFTEEIRLAVANQSKQWEDFLFEYASLFEGTSNRSIALWESAYTGSENILCDETTLAVKRFYKKHRVGAQKEENQPADHIGLECSFLELLNNKLSDCIEQQDENEFYRTIADQKEFIEIHLLRFLSPFCDRLHQNTFSLYYQSFSAFFLSFIKKDMEVLSSLVYPKEANHSISKPEKSPLGLIVLTDTELVDEPVMVVPTSGRNNCGGKCIIYAHVQEGNILKLSTDTGTHTDHEEVLSSCVRGKGYRKTFLNVSRLRYPMKRIGARGEGKFERITWEEAVNTIAEKIKTIKEKHGPSSRYINYATGVSAVIRGDNFARRLLALDGGYLGLYNSYSSACAEIATPYTYGTALSGDSSSNLLHSKLIILWGHNPVETGFGTSVHADILKAKRAGIRIIVVDPRFSDTAAAYADQWIGLRPTTDSALMDAMAYVIITENLQDQAFMDKYCVGFDRAHMPSGIDGSESYFEYILGTKDGIAKTPQWAQLITGVDEDVIIQLAREYATNKPSALIEGLGPQRHGNGEQTVRSGTMLACLTGNVGIKGGGAAGCGYFKQHNLPKIASLDNPSHVSIPSFLWTDAITRATEMNEKDDGVRGAKHLNSPIKLILNLAGNTLINQHSDINRTIKILKNTSQCEFIVCSDLFMTPSAKFADILLPGTSMFEGNNITLPWRQGDYILYNNRAISPLFESRFEYDWLVEVADKLGIKDAFTGGHQTMQEWLKSTYEATRKVETELPKFDVFTHMGGYKYKDRKEIIAFQKQIDDFEHHPFPTPSGKIEIFSKRLYDMGNLKEIPAIPKYVPSFEGPSDLMHNQYPLQLIGWHTKRRCHSIHDQNDWNTIVERQELWINPKDADLRSIQEGDLVSVWNDRGKMRVPAHVTNRIISGVVAVSQGAWYEPDKNGVDQNGSINVLTTSRPTPLAKGNPQHSNLVEVQLINAAESV